MDLIQKASAQITSGNLTLTPNTTVSDLSGLVTKVSNWVFVIAGVLAFFYLLYSGILYITASGNAEQAKKAQQGILNAIIGIVIIVFAYAIVRAVVGQL